MTSWTAEFEWQETVWTPESLGRILAILDEDVTSLCANFVTGTVTATLTQEAPSLLPALLAATNVLEGVASGERTLNRITTTNAYNRTVASNRPMNGIAKRPLGGVGRKHDRAHRGMIGHATPCRLRSRGWLRSGPPRNPMTTIVMPHKI